MTKQEEIRAGILGCIERNTHFVGVDDCPITGKENATTAIIDYLYSQGVVIKVKDIGPINSYEDLTKSISDEGKYDIVVVEPLVGKTS